VRENRINLSTVPIMEIIKMEITGDKTIEETTIAQEEIMIDRITVITGRVQTTIIRLHPAITIHREIMTVREDTTDIITREVIIMTGQETATIGQETVIIPALNATTALREMRLHRETT
jgi:hypothetical protein